MGLPSVLVNTLAGGERLKEKLELFVIVEFHSLPFSFFLFFLSLSLSLFKTIGPENCFLTSIMNGPPKSGQTRYYRVPAASAVNRVVRGSIYFCSYSVDAHPQPP
jgi:hypothetical protein